MVVLGSFLTITGGLKVTKVLEALLLSTCLKALSALHELTDAYSLLELL